MFLYASLAAIIIIVLVNVIRHLLQTIRTGFNTNILLSKKAMLYTNWVLEKPIKYSKTKESYMIKDSEHRWLLSFEVKIKRKKNDVVFFS